MLHQLCRHSQKPSYPSQGHLDVYLRYVILGIWDHTVDSQKLDHGCSMVYAGFSSFFGLRLEEDHVPTFWPLLYRVSQGLLNHQRPLEPVRVYFGFLGSLASVVIGQTSVLAPRKSEKLQVLLQEALHLGNYINGDAGGDSWKAK